MISYDSFRFVRNSTKVVKLKRNLVKAKCFDINDTDCEL